MRVLILTPWENAWIPLYRKVFAERGHEAVTPVDNPEGPFDAVLHMWADPTISRPEEFPEAPVHLVFLRRFEFFEGRWTRYDFSKVDAMVFCNAWPKDVCEEWFSDNHLAVRTELVYNAIDSDAWTFKDRFPGPKIGMACHVHPKKNLPLAMQILNQCPPDYELHIAGDIQDSCTAEYLNHLGKSMRRKVYLYGHVPHEEMDLWWEDKHFCLSTSISEGNPNNVIEAMAKGIKPVVHNWPGADMQFDRVFTTADGAALEITSRHYDSEKYRRQAMEHYGLDNYRRVVRMVEEIHG